MFRWLGLILVVTFTASGCYKDIEVESKSKNFSSPAVKIVESYLAESKKGNVDFAQVKLIQSCYPDFDLSLDFDKSVLERNSDLPRPTAQPYPIQPEPPRNVFLDFMQRDIPDLVRRENVATEVVSEEVIDKRHINYKVNFILNNSRGLTFSFLTVTEGNQWYLCRIN